MYILADTLTEEDKENEYSLRKDVKVIFYF